MYIARTIYILLGVQHCEYRVRVRKGRRGSRGAIRINGGRQLSKRFHKLGLEMQGILSAQSVVEDSYQNIEKRKGGGQTFV